MPDVKAIKLKVKKADKTYNSTYLNGKLKSDLTDTGAKTFADAVASLQASEVTNGYIVTTHEFDVD